MFRDLDIEAIWGGQESRIVADLHSDETYFVELGNRYPDESLTMILPPLGSLVVCCPELSQLQLLTSLRICLSIGKNRANQHSLRSVGIPEDGCVLFDPIVSDRKCYLSMQYSEGLVQDIGDPSGYTIGASERKHVDISLDPELWVLIRIKVIVPDHLDPRTSTPWSFTTASGITRRGWCAFSSEETYALLLRRSDKEQAGRLAIDSVGTADIDLHSLTPALVVVSSGSGNH